MSRVVFIGIDDTDVPGSPGTGKVARDVARLLVDLDLAESMGVSRHQLLVDPRVRYTSHNSSKGLAVKTSRATEELCQPCIDALARMFQPGSDPGLCICSEEHVHQGILSFGQRAEVEVLTKQEALDLAAESGVFLRELGGDGGGVIGALAAVGLRASGNNGRLVDCPGVREISGVISVGDLKRRTAILDVRDDRGTSLGVEELINSHDWVRPTLIGGIPVLRVVAEPGEHSPVRWIPAEKAMRCAKEGK